MSGATSAYISVCGRPEDTPPSRTFIRQFRGMLPGRLEPASSEFDPAASSISCTSSGRRGRLTSWSRKGPAGGPGVFLGWSRRVGKMAGRQAGRQCKEADMVGMDVDFPHASKDPKVSGDDICPSSASVHLSPSIYRLVIRPPVPERQILPVRLNHSIPCLLCVHYRSEAEGDQTPSIPAKPTASSRLLQWGAGHP